MPLEVRNVRQDPLISQLSFISFLVACQYIKNEIFLSCYVLPFSVFVCGIVKCYFLWKICHSRFFMIEDFLAIMVLG